MFKAVLVIICAVVVMGCGGIKSSRMLPTVDTAATHVTKANLAIGTVTGGRKPSFGGAEMIDNDQFSEVLLEAAKRSGAFARVSTSTEQSTELVLNAHISKQTQEEFGALGYHGILEVEYRFVDPKTDKVLWTLAIPASHRVTFGQAFSGAARTIKAREGSVRNNVTALSRSMNLWKAAAGGSLDMVTRFHKAGTNLNAQDPSGNTALMTAAAGGHVETVRYLLAQKARVNEQNQLGGSALLAALGAGHSNLASLLIEAGADIKAKSNNGESALMLAARIPNADIVRQALANGSNSNDATQQGLTALHYAALVDNNPVLTLLFEGGGRPTQQSDDVDVAIASSHAFEAFAAWQSETERANAYIAAANSYRTAMGKLDEQIQELRQSIQDDRRRQQRAVTAAEFHQTLMDIGFQMQARQNAKQLREIQALSTASSTGAGPNGYFTILRQLERSPAYAPMQYGNYAFLKPSYETLVDDKALATALVQTQQRRKTIAERLNHCEQLAGGR